MNRPLLAVELLATALLAACAPSAAPAALNQVTSAPERVGYYPVDTGLEWRYHEEGEVLTNAPLRIVGEGLALAGGENTHRVRTVGRGLDVTRYFLRRDGLHLVQEDRPGVRIEYHPPITAYPPEGALRVGARWSGSTIAHMTFPDASPDKRRSRVNMEYAYTVIDERTVSTAAGDFRVYVIDLTATEFNTGREAQTVSQEIWFAPYIGEVRTPTGFYLTAFNAPVKQP